MTSRYFTFQLSPPPTTNTDTIVSIGPDHLNEPQLPPRSDTENTIPGPGSHPAGYQHQNFLRPTPNDDSDWPGPSDEDKDNSYGPNN